MKNKILTSVLLAMVAMVAMPAYSFACPPPPAPGYDGHDPGCGPPPDDDHHCPNPEPVDLTLKECVM